MRHCRVVGLRVGIRRTDSIVPRGVQLVGQVDTTGFDNSPTQHHMREVGRIVFQQLVVVGDNQ